MRIGHGYDLHKLTAGNGVSLAGVNIACDYAIVAHSDGDVAIHALCDALLGALALGDIGQHFPDNSADNAGKDSAYFLQHIYGLVKDKDYQVANLDITIIAEVPKLAPHVTTMRETLANLLNIKVDQVSVKATTNEGLSDIGAKQAIASHAVVLLIKN